MARDEPFDLRLIEGGERHCNDAGLARVGDMGGRIAGMRVLADMQEPIAGAVPLQAMELAPEDYLDRPDPVDRDRQQQPRRALDARRRFTAALGCRRGEPLGHVGRQFPLRPHMPRHEVERGLADEPDILRGACRIQRAEVRDDHGSVGLLQRDQVSGRIESEISKACARVFGRFEGPSRLRHVHELQRVIEMRCKFARDARPVRPIKDPRARRSATEADHVPAGPDLDPGDGRGLPAHDAVRFEMKLR